MKLKPEEINLTEGAHESPEIGMCLLEAAAYIAGEPHSDHPRCVCPVLAAFGRAWNDGLESDGERNRLLRPLIPRLIDTNAGIKVSEKRAWIALDWLIRVYWPEWMDLTESLREHAAILRALPEQTSEREILASAAARAAARDAAEGAAVNAAGAVAHAAARTARESAREAAVDAAVAAARAAGAAAWAAAGPAVVNAVVNAAVAAARTAARTAAVNTAGAAAWAATHAATRTALKPTTEKLKASALELFVRMIDAK